MNVNPKGDHVLIVGAGHIGIACAHYLQADGYRVTVLDQGNIASACSLANCGFLASSHVMPLTTPQNLLHGVASIFQPRASFRIQPQLRRNFYKWVYQFARRCTQRQALAAARVLHEILDASMHEYRELLQVLDDDCEFRDCGLLFVFQSEKSLQAFARTNDFLRDELGVYADPVSSSELSDLDTALNNGLAGAFHHREDAYLNPQKLNTAWSNDLINRGVTFRPNTVMTGLHSENGKIKSVITSEGEIEADHYVFSMGAWSGQLAQTIGCNLPVEPGKGYSVTMSAPSSQPQYPMLFPEANIGVTPFADSLRIGSMMEFVGYNKTLPQHRIQKLVQSARKFLDVPEKPAIKDAWYGWRPMTWDGLPIIGRAPNLANAFIATGHNMLGLTLAPVTGKAIAALVSEKPSQLPLKSLSPQRFA